MSQSDYSRKLTFKLVHFTSIDVGGNRLKNVIISHSADSPRYEHDDLHEDGCLISTFRQIP
jgi:hypothetical protein